MNDKCTKMISVRLDPETEARLAYLARETGRTKTYYVREALARYLEDLEDIYLADKAMEDLRAGRSRTVTTEELSRELGLDD